MNQRELLPDTIDRIKLEVPSPALANACLQKVQMSISFILKSGSTLGTEKSGAAHETKTPWRRHGV